VLGIYIREAADLISTKQLSDISFDDLMTGLYLSNDLEKRN